MKCGAFNLPESIWAIKTGKMLSFEFFIAHYDIMNV
jgi:hypothetical protein